jgi:phage shock protein A
MSSELLNVVIAVLSAILGGGGYAAYVRANGQNRVDLYQAAVERIARLEARTDEQDRRNDQLSQANAELNGKIAAITHENESQSERLRVQRVLIDEQSQRVAKLGTLEEENGRLRQQLQIEMSKREFLEREVRTLRQEIAELRARLTKEEERSHA